MEKKIYTGKVISDKMNKTVTVAITRLFQHKRYKKTLKRITKLKAYDEQNACSMGDIVRIVESRPTSKTKRWSVLDIVEKA